MLRLDLTTVVVPDYEVAIAFYVGALGFTVTEDRPVDGSEPGRRWVVVRPASGTAPGLLLARAKNEAERARLGDQTGGRVAFFATTDDFTADHHRLVAAGVRFLEAVRHEPYGRVAKFEDPFGNRWDLLEAPGQTQPPA